MSVQIANMKIILEVSMTVIPRFFVLTVPAGLLTYPGSCAFPSLFRFSDSGCCRASLAGKAEIQQRVLFRIPTGFPIKSYDTRQSLQISSNFTIIQNDFRDYIRNSIMLAGVMHLKPASG